MGRQSMTQECCAAAYELTAVDCMHRENDLHAMGGAQKGFLKRPEKIYKEGSGLKKLGAEYQKRRYFNSFQRKCPISSENVSGFSGLVILFGADGVFLYVWANN